MLGIVAANAIINKIGIFILAAMCVYFAYKLLSNLELQKLGGGETVGATIGKDIKINAAKLLPGSIFIIGATIMVVLAYQSPVTVGSDGTVSFVRGLGPDAGRDYDEHKKLITTLETVLGILDSPTSQFSEQDVRTLKDARPDLAKLKEALERTAKR